MPLKCESIYGNSIKEMKNLSDNFKKHNIKFTK